MILRNKFLAVDSDLMRETAVHYRVWTRAPRAHDGVCLALLLCDEIPFDMLAHFKLLKYINPEKRDKKT